MSNRDNDIDFSGNFAPEPTNIKPSFQDVKHAYLSMSVVDHAVGIGKGMLFGQAVFFFTPFLIYLGAFIVMKWFPDFVITQGYAALICWGTFLFFCCDSVAWLFGKQFGMKTVIVFLIMPIILLLILH